jgi:hypothetical protein
LVKKLGELQEVGKSFGMHEGEGSPKGNASPPRQGPCRVERLGFGTN